MAGPGLEEAGPAAAQRQAAVLRPELEQGRSWKRGWRLSSDDGSQGRASGSPRGSAQETGGSTHTQAPVPADPALGASEGQCDSRTWRPHQDSPAPRDSPRRAPGGQEKQGPGSQALGREDTFLRSQS